MTMSQPKRIAHADLEQFFLDALAAAGVPPHVAAVEAQIGAEVDLHGGHTHGVALLPAAINYIRQGVLAPDPCFETIVEYPASRLIDAGGGIGRFSSAYGMDWALERARQYGVGSCVVRNVGHWGRGHSYALRAASRRASRPSFHQRVRQFSRLGHARPFPRQQSPRHWHFPPPTASPWSSTWP